MNNLLKTWSAKDQHGRAGKPILLVVCLLIGIRLVAGAISEVCFYDLEVPPVRTVHIHSAGDHDHCHHGRYSVPPLLAWACSACKDATEFTLPDIPRLPVPVSFFVSLFLLLHSFSARPLIAARGRGPPLSH